MTTPWDITEKIDFVLVKSYELRCKEVLSKALDQKWRINQLAEVGFKEYNSQPRADVSHYDIEAFEKYWKRSEECDKLIENIGINPNKHSLSFDTARGTSDIIGSIHSSPSTVLVIDISCIPRLQLSALIWAILKSEIKRRERIYLAYTRVSKHFQEEERFTVGVKDFVGIPGLSGKIRHEDSVCILIAGFEGNRAYAAFRHLSPRETHVFVGSPGDEGAESYLKTAKRNNHQILANHRVTASVSNSLDPIEFGSDLLDEISKMKKQFEECNIFVVPLGTKIQTIGGILAAQYYPEVQFLFTLPAHRRISSQGIGKTIYLDFQEILDAYDKKVKIKQKKEKTTLGNQ